MRRKIRYRWEEIAIFLALTTLAVAVAVGWEAGKVGGPAVLAAALALGWVARFMPVRGTEQGKGGIASE